MRGRISTEIHGWNGMILWDACKPSVESDGPDVGGEGGEGEGTEDEGVARWEGHDGAGGRGGEAGEARSCGGAEARAGEARGLRRREMVDLRTFVLRLLADKG